MLPKMSVPRSTLKTWQTQQLQSASITSPVRSNSTGRVRREDFQDLMEAERFASAQLRDADSWAVIDQVDTTPSNRMVA